MAMAPYCVVLFYKYTHVPCDALDKVVMTLTEYTEENKLKGRILIAEEGINGTIAGCEDNVKKFTEYLPTLESCNFIGIDWKFSYGEGDLPFVDMFIKQSKELISTGEAKGLIQQHSRFDPESFGGIGGTGTHLSPSEFHAALECDPKAVVLDIRNDFEYDIGHFQGALSMKTNTFSETWNRLDGIISELNEEQSSDKSSTKSTSDETSSSLPANGRNYYMYCTGGIRCEKASVYLKAKGLDNVFQLQGGIHRYLEEFPDTNKKFLGRNFVFDSRMIDKSKSDTHNVPVAEGQSEGAPMTDTDILGRCVGCGCPHDTYTEDQRCVVCRQPVLVCPQCKHQDIKTEYNERLRSSPLTDMTKVQNDYHCKNHRYLKDFYFKNLKFFTVNALNNQINSLQLLEGDEAFSGKMHKNRRKTIRNQVNKIEGELARRMLINDSDGESDTAVIADESGGSGRKVVGGIWGP